MKLLFISRTYPPLVGGMEKFASDFYNNYSRQWEMDLIANKGGKKRLPIFFLRVVIELIFHSRKYDVIHFYDAVLSPLILWVRLFSRAKVTFTVNGLDIVYTRFGYQKFTPYFLAKADRIIAISQYTMEQCLLRGIPEDKLVVIPVGYNFETVKALTAENRAAIMSGFGIPWKEKKILITVGRLVKRKGHAWFIEHVLIGLPKEYIYLIIGDGPEMELLSELVINLGLAGRVYLLGQVSDEEKGYFYQVADLFVMPNIRVENDQEGFGIVLLEAGQYGLPVVASNIEGVSDVILDNVSGVLIDETNSIHFVDSILRFQPDRSAILPAISSKFDWDKVITKYFETFQSLFA